MKTLVLSDLHLGDGTSSDLYAGGSALVELLRNPDSPWGEIVLNGDTVDFLGREGSLDFDVKHATDDAHAIAAAPATAAFFEALGEVLAAGGRAVLRVGNHDLELAMAPVQEVFRQALRQPPVVAARLIFLLGDEALLRDLGGTRYLIAHGDQNDRWSKVDYKRLPGPDNTVPLEKGPLRYPPGSILVKKVLNGLRRDHGMLFLHSMVPHFGAASVAAFAVDNSLLKGAFKEARLDIENQLLRNDETGANFADNEVDLGLSTIVQGAALPKAELDLLESTLKAAPAQTNVVAEPTRESGGLFSRITSKLVRMAVRPPSAQSEAGEMSAEQVRAGDDTREAARLAEKFGASVVLMGHFHVARWEPIGAAVYVNTGAWTDVLQMPAADADEQTWVDFVQELRDNPSLDPARSRLARTQRKLTYATLEPGAREGMRVTLAEWVPGQGEVVMHSEELPPTAAAAQVAVGVAAASGTEGGSDVLPRLPQSEKDRDRKKVRDKALERARQTYGYRDDSILTHLPIAREVPKADSPQMDWWKMIMDCFLRARSNNSSVAAEAEASRAAHLSLTYQITELWSKLKEGSAADAFSATIKPFLQEGHITGRPANRKNYRDVYRLLPEPEIAFRYGFDTEFARMRVAGPNPMSLRLSTTPDDRFPVTEEHFQVACPGDTLAAARAEGRLYMLDYSALDGVPGGKHENGARKFVAAPLALFAVPPRTTSSRALRAVAIQLSPQPGPAAPVLTPRDGVAWTMAKACVQSADAAIHQVISHLAHTHLVIERLALATRRQLAAVHPLSVLLRPHFEGTLSINAFAVSSLIQKGGNVDRTFGPAIETIQGLAAASALAWDFSAYAFPTALAARGVDDPERLPEYPYRDDGRLVWEAMREWVSAYVSLYYLSDADVAADAELSAWVRELAAPDGGRMKGVGRDGKIATRDDLSAAMLNIIFTASAQHAAVNFPQADIMSFSPAFPLSLYAPPPGLDYQNLTEQDALNMLPPLDMAQLQLDICYLLGNARHTRLGEYPKEAAFLDPGEDPAKRRGYFADPRVAAPLAVFRARLASIEDELVERDRTRQAYPFMRPTLIPQSINI